MPWGGRLHCERGVWRGVHELAFSRLFFGYALPGLSSGRLLRRGTGFFGVDYNFITLVDLVRSLNTCLVVLRGLRDTTLPWDAPGLRCPDGGHRKSRRHPIRL